MEEIFSAALTIDIVAMLGSSPDILDRGENSPFEMMVFLPTPKCFVYKDRERFRSMI